jgi:hypothetical protein
MAMLEIDQGGSCSSVDAGIKDLRTGGSLGVDIMIGRGLAGGSSARPGSSAWSRV